MGQKNKNAITAKSVCWKTTPIFLASGKKIENKRLYFLVSEKTKRILLIAFATKKDQQRTIDRVLLEKEKYRCFVEKA